MSDRTILAWRWSAIFALFGAVTVVCSVPVTAIDDLPGDPQAGRDLATQVCTECHDVAREGGISPNRFAPGFHDLARQPSTTALSLRVFLQSPHRRMPNLILSEQERDDVIVYILSLRGCPKL